MSCRTADCLACLAKTAVSKRSDLVDDRNAATTMALFLEDAGIQIQNTTTCQRGNQACSGAATWNNDFCYCQCTKTNEIFTPQYGCFDLAAYSAGQVPAGTLPRSSFIPTAMVMPPVFRFTRPPFRHPRDASYLTSATGVRLDTCFFPFSSFRIVV